MSKAKTKTTLKKVLELKEGYSLRNAEAYAEELVKAIYYNERKGTDDIDMHLALEMARDPQNPLHGWSGFVWDADRAITLVNLDRMRRLVKQFDIITIEVTETITRSSQPVEIVEREVDRHSWVQGSHGIVDDDDSEDMGLDGRKRPSRYNVINKDNKELLKETLVFMAKHFLGYMHNKAYAWQEFKWLVKDIETMQGICEKIIKRFEKKKKKSA